MSEHGQKGTGRGPHGADFLPHGRVPNWSDVERLAATCPIAHAWYTMHRRGDVAREECLIGMVLTLADANTRSMRLEIERDWRRPIEFLTPTEAPSFGVGPDEVLFCPACKRGGPASLAPRRPDGVFHCPLCTGLLTPLLVPPTPDTVYFPGAEDAAPGDPTPEIRT